MKVHWKIKTHICEDDKNSNAVYFNIGFVDTEQDQCILNVGMKYLCVNIKRNEEILRRIVKKRENLKQLNIGKYNTGEHMKSTQEEETA